MSTLPDYFTELQTNVAINQTGRSPARRLYWNTNFPTKLYAVGAQVDSPYTNWVMRFDDTDDLTQQTFITSSTYFFNDIVYSETNGKFYVATGTSDNARLLVVEVDPTTWVKTDVIDVTGAANTGTAKSICCDATYLYILSYWGLVYRYALSDFSSAGSVDLYSGFLLQYLDCIRADSTSLYISQATTGGDYDCSVVRMNRASFSYSDSVSLPIQFITNQLCIYGDSIWVGSEYDLPENEIFRVQITDLSIYHSIYQGFGYGDGANTSYVECFGGVADAARDLIWFGFGAPRGGYGGLHPELYPGLGKIVALDPNTEEVAVLDTVAHSPKRLALDNNGLIYAAHLASAAENNYGVSQLQPHFPSPDLTVNLQDNLNA